VRIVILAVGSRGDVQPFVPLAAGLEAAGFEVVVATHPPYRDLVDAQGLGYHCIGANAAALLESSAVLLMGDTGRNPIAWARKFRDMTREIWSEVVPDCEAVCADADAVLFSILGHPGYSIAEKLGIPSVGAPLQPISATRAFPNVNVGSAVASFGSVGNRVSHALGEQLGWLPVRKLVQDWRRDSLGLAPIPIGGLLRKVRKDRYPVIYGFSPTLVPHPPDWGDWIRITGYWFSPPTETWDAPPELERFLAGGPPVVFAGFGSVPTLHAERLLADVCQAARNVGARLVATTGGWLGGRTPPPGEDVCLVDEAPHDWLFSRVGAVIHHGGSGTTHCGVRSGRPAVVVPSWGDQFFWGHRAARAGAATAPIPRKKANADRLTTALDRALNDAALRRRADEVGAAVSAERGVDEAVATLQRWLK
jgi:UDP:flavonoid glycosyltransferase YjiC (YdhE family)